MKRLMNEISRFREDVVQKRNINLNEQKEELEQLKMKIKELETLLNNGVK